MIPEGRCDVKGIVFSLLASVLQEQHALVDNSNFKRKGHYLSLDLKKLLSRH